MGSRYFVIGFGKVVEVRAAATPPVGLVSKLVDKNATKVTLKREMNDWGYYSSVPVKKKYKLVRKQVVYLGGRVLGIVPTSRFEAVSGISVGNGKMVEITNEVRAKILRYYL